MVVVQSFKKLLWYVEWWFTKTTKIIISRSNMNHYKHLKSYTDFANTGKWYGNQPKKPYVIFHASAALFSLSNCFTFSHSVYQFHVHEFCIMFSNNYCFQLPKALHIINFVLQCWASIRKNRIKRFCVFLTYYPHIYYLKGWGYKIEIREVGVILHI